MPQIKSIQITALVTTLNEEKNLARCLESLKNFDEIIVIDSGSIDKTTEIAKSYGADIVSFTWNGKYPKKRQWCLDNVKTRHDYIFFIDADEQAPEDFLKIISQLDFKKAGYFVRAKYVWNGKILQYGLQNNKLVLFDKNKFQFPVVDDLGDFCMGEMEGHYQPVLKDGFVNEAIGQIVPTLLHYACDDFKAWHNRHDKYATWEAGMIKNNAYPSENNKGRDILKRIFRRLPFRPVIAFAHSYVLKRGFLDGRAGFYFALSRYHYYRKVRHALATNKA